MIGSVEKVSGVNSYQFLETPEDIENNILSKYDAFIFDMDGVLWTVDTPFPGAADALAYLRSKNKRVFFATNNSLYLPEEYAAKISRLGLGEFSSESVFCSSRAVALYLEQRKYKGKVYLMGPDALKTELETLDGVEIVDSNSASRPIMPWDMSREEVDASIGAVVLGFDPNFSYYKLAYAVAILNKNPNAFFVYTNKDRKFPTQRWVLPGTGAFVAAVEAAVDRPGIPAGKPSPVIINEILRTFPDLTREHVCMVGDNILTDVLFGKENGLTTIMVETGVHSRQDLSKPEYANMLPRFVIPSVASLNVLPSTNH